MASGKKDEIQHVERFADLNEKLEALFVMHQALISAVRMVMSVDQTNRLAMSDLCEFCEDAANDYLDLSEDAGEIARPLSSFVRYEAS